MKVVVAQVIVVLFILSAVAMAQQEDPPESSHQEAAMRLLRASLSAPNSNVEEILNDAKLLLGNVLPESIYEHLLIEASNSASCDTAVDGGSIEEENAALASNDPKFCAYELLYADRHARRIDATKDEFDCMEREFDASSPDFDAAEAAAVFRKCRLLVIRNLFSPQVIDAYKTNVTKFLNDVHFAKINQISKTTLGENGYHASRGDKRFDIVMPRHFLDQDIIADEKLMKILSNQQVFGSRDDFVVQCVGTVIAESGADDSHYHTDMPYLFGDSAINGVASGDLPPYSATMFIPMLNMTTEHGPTEFCMGTNHYHGLSIHSRFRNESLFQDGTVFSQVEDFENSDGKLECPEPLRRSPLGNLGDAILFDYTLTHRGTRNASPDLRAMSYAVYARPWYRDAANFADDVLEHTMENAGDYSHFQQLTLGTRLALVEHYDEEYERMPLESIRNFLHPVA